MNAKIITQRIENDRSAMSKRYHATYCYNGLFHFYENHYVSAGGDQLVVRDFAACSCISNGDGREVILNYNLEKVVDSVLKDGYSEKTNFLIKRHIQEFSRYEDG